MNYSVQLRFGIVSLLCAVGFADVLPPLDSGLPKVRVVATDPTAVEGGSTGLFTFVRDGAATNDLALRVVYSGSATNGVDYLPLTNVVTIPAGQRAVDLLVQPISELLTGHDRTVKVHLLATDTYVLGSPKTATVTIVENGLHVFPPSVQVVSPTNGAVIVGAIVPLVADVSDTASTIKTVLFYSGDHRLVELKSAPYQWTWSNVAAGGHTVRAWAEDSLGNWTVSDPVTITVTNSVPLVSIVTPTNHTVIHGPADVTVTATASNADSPIAHVDFLANHHLLGTVTNGDASGNFSLVLTNLHVGKFSIEARAMDQLGRETTSSAVELDLTNAPPHVTLNSPVSGAEYGVSHVIAFNATADDSDGVVSKVVFVVDGKTVGSVSNAPYSLTLTNLPPGLHSSRARAVDNAGLSAWSELSKFSVTNQPPAVVLTAPADHSIFVAGATIVLQANPTVTDGTVKSVSFFANGRLLGSVSSAPFSYDWTKVKAGQYRLRAVVRTSYGVETDSSVVNISVSR